MQDKSDAQLLREYVAQKSDAAFGEIVRRHANLVYSAALRQAGSADWAADIAQRVFIDLARKAKPVAGQLRDGGSVAGWLYRATRYTALNLLREEGRRQARERTIMEDSQPTSGSAPDWHHLAVLLDEAMSALSEQDREAVVLRFFEKQDFRRLGAALGVSDDAAQKRVARSLEKLRLVLVRRGVTTTAAALSGALTANAVHAAPAGLASAWISASLAGAVAETGRSLTLIKIMSMSKIQIGLTTVVVGGLAVTATLQHQAGLRARAENDTLRQQVAALVADNAAYSNRLQNVPAPAAGDDSQRRELLRLRGEVGMLRQQTNAAAKLLEENRRLQSRPQVAEGALQNQNLRIRTVNAAKILGVAVRVWANDNNNVFPTNFASISNELGTGLGDFPVETFEMVNSGKTSVQTPGAVFARERDPRPAAQGGWERVYLLCDGSVQVAHSPDGNFDGWEQSNTAPVTANR